MKTFTTEATPIWAKSTTDINHPLTEWEPAANLEAVRVTAEMRNRNGDIEFQAFVQGADDPYDPSSWTAVTLLGTAVTANGVVAGTAFESVVSAKRFLRFGAAAANASSSNLNLCYAVLRIDRRNG